MSVTCTEVAEIVESGLVSLQILQVYLPYAQSYLVHDGCGLKKAAQATGRGL